MAEIISSKDKNVRHFQKNDIQPNEEMVIGIGCSDGKGYKAFIATTKRVLVYNKGSFFSGPASYQAIPLDKISSVKIENTGFLSRGFKLKIQAAGSKLSLHCIDGFGLDVDGGKSKSQLYRDELLAAIENAKESNSSSSGAEHDLVAQLDKLSELHTSGALTDDEFTSAKGRLGLSKSSSPRREQSQTSVASKKPEEKQKASSPLRKGCLLFFGAFMFLTIYVALFVERHSLTIEILPHVNATVSVTGPSSQQLGGSQLVFRNLLEGSYTFQVKASGYETYQGSFEIPKNKNLAVSLKPSKKTSPATQKATQDSHNNDQVYPFKLVSILSQPIQFGGMQCALTPEGKGWQESKAFGGWYATLRRSFGQNEVSCLLESSEVTSVQRVELEAEFYQPGAYENEMLLQFGSSAQILMHPTKPSRDFSDALVNKTSWSNAEWSLTREPYDNGGFGLKLRKK